MSSLRIRLAFAAGIAALALANAPARAQWVVFDPTNYAQNVLTAARELQQVKKAEGNTLMLKYKDGEKTIVVPFDATVVQFADDWRAGEGEAGDAGREGQSNTYASHCAVS